jgi:hypothetical protein
MHGGIKNCTVKTQEGLCPLRMRRRRKLAINILSLQSSIYAVLGKQSTDLSTGQAHTRVFRYGWKLGFSSTTCSGATFYKYPKVG